MRRHRSGSGSGGRSGGQQSLVREFEATRPARPSPLAASAIRDMPLDLVDRLRSFPLFASAPESFLVAVGAHLKPQLYAPQESILTEGDEAKAMYWLVRGGVTVTSKDRESTYAELKPGAFFGEIGILMDIPRTASIVARYKTLAVKLNKDDLRKILPEFPDVEQTIREEAAERLRFLQRKKTEKNFTAPAQSIKIGAKIGKRTHDSVEEDVDMGDLTQGHDGEVPAFKKRKSPSPSLVEAAASSALSSGGLNIRNLLKGLPLFSPLPNDVLHYVGLNAQPRSYPPFTDIMREGSSGREIFFITDGEVEVYTEPPNKQGPPNVKARLKFGQYFGEVTSLSLAPQRTASVRSVTSVECLVISGDVQDGLWQRCGPEVRQQIEVTARRRLEETKGVDVQMRDASSVVTPHFDDLAITTRTPDAKLSSNVPSSVHKSAPTSFEPFDPDPFSDGDRVPKRPRDGRRGSIPNIPSETSPLADNEARSRSTSPSTSPSSSKPPSTPSTPHQRPSISRQARPRFLHRPASQLSKGILPDNVLIAVFQQLDVYQLMRLRAVSVHWSRLLSSSNDLLETLDLRPYNRRVTDTALAHHICPFVGPRPRIINISNCFHISDEGFNALASHCGANVEIWKMKSVWDISAQAVVSMANKARNLEEIDFSNCRKVSDNLLGRVIGWIQRSGSHSHGRHNSMSNNGALSNSIPDGTIVGCPSLSRLTLSYCKHISDQSMAHLARHAASRLEEINFTRCTTITDLGFRHWSESAFPRLRKLVLADCTYLSDNAIVYLTHAAKGLEELDLSFCCALSDTATEVLSLGLPSLTHLNLAFCGSAVSDNSMRSIGLHLHKLRFISVRGCVRVTGVGVEAIVQGCSWLEVFDVSQCKNLRGWLDSGGVGRWRGRGVKFETVADGKWRVGE